MKERNQFIIVICCISDAASTRLQQTAHGVGLIGAAIWSFSTEQLFSVCSTLDHD